MSLFDLAAIVLSLAAIFGYVNYRFLGLPTSIGVVLVSLLFSLGLIAAQHLGSDLATQARRIIERINFDKALMHGMLGFLLFAGALNLYAGRWTLSGRVCRGDHTWARVRLGDICGAEKHRQL
jgi:CPA1 family monovalent cation:H+ antiporter